ncbi:Endonuclease III [Methanophagales archaeon]|nr:Endonuclease III [Methanophagales archaeon]
MDKIELLLANFTLYTEDLGIDLTKPAGRFKWVLASILFGARISEKIASNTYKAFEMYGVDSMEKIIAAGWDELVKILDEGGYVRYNFSTATKLLDIVQTLKDKYGSLENLYSLSSDTKDLARMLQEFKGIGAVTAQIFLRELRGVWQISPDVSSKAKSVAENLDINLHEFEGEQLSRVETALVKLGIKYCKRKRCEDCPVKDFCKSR